MKNQELIEVNIDKQGSYDFEGHIESVLEAPLAPAISGWLILQGAEPIAGQVEHLSVLGDFSIEWDDDIPMVQIEEIYLSYGTKHLNIIDFVDLDKLSEELAERGDQHEWYTDKLSSAIDNAMDRMKEGDL